VTDRCLVAGGDVLTHADVQRLSTGFAKLLVDRGFGANRRVAVLSPNDLAVMVATLGILRAGATWIPLNPYDSIDTVGELCRLFAVDAVVAHRDFAELGSIRLDEALTAEPFRGHLPQPGELALAAVFPTGGTTGVPKGVCFSHRTLGAIVANFAQFFAHDEPVFLAAGPLSHVAGRSALGVIAAGGTVVVLPRFEAGAALEAIERHRVTAMILPVTLLNRLVAHPAVASTDLSSLRRVWVGAAPVPVESIKRAIAVFGPVVCQNYGQTEAPTFVTSMQPDDYFVDGELADDSRLASCGRATPFSEVRVVDADGDDIAPGDVGEIVVRGNFVMDGYLDDPIATRATRVGGWHRTGDLGTLDAEGYLTIVGRSRDVIITGGFNVYPAEVEAVLAERPEVHESAVVGVPDAEWGERIVAVVEPADGKVCDADELRRYVRDRLGSVKAPKEVVIVDSLPRNANGKILKRDLLDRLTR
jgi:acyl-CoA synthetase (AMP-forming)/AMP-acid ligase II